MPPMSAYSTRTGQYSSASKTRVRVKEQLPQEATIPCFGYRKLSCFNWMKFKMQRATLSYTNSPCRRMLFDSWKRFRQPTMSKTWATMLTFILISVIHTRWATLSYTNS